MSTDLRLVGILGSEGFKVECKGLSSEQGAQAKRTAGFHAQRIQLIPATPLPYTPALTHAEQKAAYIWENH